MHPSGAGGGHGGGGCPTLRRGTGGVQQRAQGAEAVLGELERPAHVEQWRREHEPRLAQREQCLGVQRRHGRVVLVRGGLASPLAVPLANRLRLRAAELQHLLYPLRHELVARGDGAGQRRDAAVALLVRQHLQLAQGLPQRVRSVIDVSQRGRGGHRPPPPGLAGANAPRRRPPYPQAGANPAPHAQHREWGAGRQLFDAGAKERQNQRGYE